MTYTTLFFLGFLAGVLQLLGYWLYIKNDQIDPNPVTWFMFAYGTAILTVLEWDQEATAAELILPTVCALFAVIVSARCWIRARQLDPTRWWPHDWWPEDQYERVSFISDIFITLGYVTIWLLTTSSFLTSSEKAIGVMLFLLLSNLSTFPAFYPIINTTFRNPEREHWLPWIVWGIAYGTLGLLTYLSHGALWHILMFYPVSNAVLHLLVGVLAIDRVSNYFRLRFAGYFQQ